MSVDALERNDPLRQSAALSYVPGRSGDMVIVYRPGWMNTGTGTTHGSPSADDQRVPLIFYGQGIKAGTYATPATPADLVPTLANIVNIGLPDAVGRPLTPALMPTTNGSSSASVQ